MAHEEAGKPAVNTKLVIRNIGLLLSGDLSRPILDADTVVVRDGRIAAVGKEKLGRYGRGHAIHRRQWHGTCPWPDR